MSKRAYENAALEVFQNIVKKHGLRAISGQTVNNRLTVSNHIYFQFGDLRVTTKTKHIVIEIDVGGGISNLVKYWYALNYLANPQLPITLLHLFFTSTKHEYESHFAMWDFFKDKMEVDFPGRFEATRYVSERTTGKYKGPVNDNALKLLKEQLEKNPIIARFQELIV